MNKFILNKKFAVWRKPCSHKAVRLNAVKINGQNIFVQEAGARRRDKQLLCILLVPVQGGHFLLDHPITFCTTDSQYFSEPFIKATFEFHLHSNSIRKYLVCLHEAACVLPVAFSCSCLRFCKPFGQLSQPIITTITIIAHQIQIPTMTWWTWAMRILMRYH